MSLVIVGFRCVVRAPDGKGKPILISKTFTVKAAAEQYVELARKAGHSSATLETVYGCDLAGPSLAQ
jgi:hypothetical protein